MLKSTAFNLTCQASKQASNNSDCRCEQVDSACARTYLHNKLFTKQRAGDASFPDGQKVVEAALKVLGAGEHTDACSSSRLIGFGNLHTQAPWLRAVWSAQLLLETLCTWIWLTSKAGPLA